MNMNSRERVISALNFEPTDRVPLDLGGNQTGITRGAYEALLNYLGWNEEIE
ncbi:MAG TPA: uroporphyrinogen decarboxylase, partial [Armatimonadetes bacterium]|nr:uroporphyrinogen decarboxylase [Armatimonadota bacterium]